LSFHETAHFQADACDALGSPFTATLCRIFADLPTNAGAVAQKLSSWPGDPSARGGAVALRLAGALHALVLLERHPALVAQYPPHHDLTNIVSLRAAVHSALIDEEAFILQWLKSPPQTNEVRRSSALIPAFHTLASKLDMPFVLSELGASAGLNMIWDQFALSIGDHTWGDPQSPVQLNPDWSGSLPPKTEIRIQNRAACDQAPLSPDNPDDRLRLLAYTWPDQSERMQRTKAALAMAATGGFNVERADAADWLETRLKTSCSGSLHIVYHSIFWQYLPKETANRASSLLKTAGNRATRAAPLAWLRLEPDVHNDGAAITLTLWPSGQTVTLGRADFHGRWVRWAGLTSPK
jgi:hypothetical protein